MDDEYASKMPCLKCGNPIDNQPHVFSSEWDAFCHTSCCPAYNPEKHPDNECTVCDVYRSHPNEITNRP